jgi:hypothetical protein
MADDKKAKPSNDVITELVYLLAGLFLLSVIISRLDYYISQWDTYPWASVWSVIIGFFVRVLLPLLQTLLIIGGVLAGVGIAHNLRKLKAINLEERQIYGISSTTIFEKPADEVRNSKWDRVLSLINSTNSSDWRQAIIEADVMLDELLKAGGYHGDSVGEMLKSVEPSDMVTLEAAWEAHKVRNKIAHQAGDFPLNEREAKHTIALFESVFKEFGII